MEDSDEVSSPGKEMEYSKLLRFVAQECVFSVVQRGLANRTRRRTDLEPSKTCGENPYLVVKLKSLSFVSFLLPPPPAICDKVEGSIPAQK